MGRMCREFSLIGICSDLLFNVYIYKKVKIYDVTRRNNAYNVFCNIIKHARNFDSRK